MPNSLAYLALLLSPLAVALLFKRLPADRALIWSILGAYLLLPSASHVYIDPPAIPALDKMSLPALSAYLCATLMRGIKVPLWPESMAGKLLLAGFVLSPLGTVMTNAEPIFGAGGLFLPGLSLYDGVSVMLSQAFMVLTFALARCLLTTTDSMREVLIALCVAGLAYSAPMLVEIRLSPQINTWVYGFFQHSFDQMMRQGGFRPIVFLPHGLWVAFFAMTTVLASLALARETEPPARTKRLMIAGYLFVILVLCKSIGSLIYAVIFSPLMYLAPKRLLMRLALIMGLLALCYPMFRASSAFPAKGLVEFAAQYSADRAQSLGFRLDNEEMLLGRAREKPVFGWGGYDRNFVHDPETGEALTVTDGQWIITLGSLGWVGFVSEFGLLCLPLWLLWRREQLTGTVSIATTGLMIIQGINMVDLLPNATLTPLTWLATGALLGHAEALARGTADPDGDEAEIRPDPAQDTGQRTIL